MPSTFRSGTRGSLTWSQNGSACSSQGRTVVEAAQTRMSRDLQESSGLVQSINGIHFSRGSETVDGIVGPYTLLGLYAWLSQNDQGGAAQLRNAIVADWNRVITRPDSQTWSVSSSVRSASLSWEVAAALIWIGTAADAAYSTLSIPSDTLPPAFDVPTPDDGDAAGIITCVGANGAVTQVNIDVGSDTTSGSGGTTATTGNNVVRAGTADSGASPLGIASMSTGAMVAAAVGVGVAAAVVGVAIKHRKKHRGTRRTRRRR